LICCHGNASCDVIGGGDGAALRELLTYSPNMVIMIEVSPNMVIMIEISPNMVVMIEVRSCDTMM